MAFTHLHFHTSYSFLDGYNPIDRAVARVKELGMTSCAITDHNHLGGVPAFQNECIKQGIKPLLGLEGYYTVDRMQISKDLKLRKKDAQEKAINEGAITTAELKKYKAKELNEFLKPYMYDTRSYHILFIAKNQKGWHNLVKIQSISAKDGKFNGRFHCDMELLKKHNEGVICTTACIGSFPARMLEVGNYDLAEQYILDMQNIFKDDFYLEIQPLAIDKQIRTNLFYLEMAKKHNIKIIATNDVHYTRKEDHDDHDTLLCIGTGQKKKNTDRMKYSNDFWIKSEQEMEESFINQLNLLEDKDDDLKQEYINMFKLSIQNTQDIVNKVEEGIKLGSDVPLFPAVQTKNNTTASQYLTILAWQGLFKYLSDNPELDKDIYFKRLAQELEIINLKGYAPYFLTVYEYVNWCHKESILVGPGRGSAAGALTLFVLGITQLIDPIKENLLFSRFLTADRTSPPDIDVDFEYTNRDRVIHHLEDYYGIEFVSHIGTYSELKVKSGIKDVCRVLDIPFLEANNISKEIDALSDDPSLSFAKLDALKEGDENEQQTWKKFNALENKYKEIFRLARAFENTPRGVGVHASGILVTPIPVTDIFPVRYDNDGTAITLYTGVQLEEYFAIKLDILGLRTLSVIQKAIDNIDTIDTIDDLYKAIDFSDEKVYEMIANGETDCTFQISSDMMKGIIKEIKPSDFRDIVAITSLGRPGPLSAGMNTQYAMGKHNGEFSYVIRGCEDILDKTYGVLCYQEQLMAISKKVSGFDDNQADSITRKVLAKKKLSMFPMMKRCHIYGKINSEGPSGWENDDKAPWYDPKGKYGGEISGALVNGYTEEELLEYFDEIEGFSSYAFNKSHAATYSAISFITAWLKYYYPTEFYAAYLSMSDDTKAEMAVMATQKDDIMLAVPNINLSKYDYTPKDNIILYGLNSIKSVGDTSIPDIIANAPYESLEDAFNRIPRRAFNKRVATNLIKAGAFDWYNPNRVSLLNELYELRKDKVEKLDPLSYDKKMCMDFEQETIGTHITYKDWWEKMPTNKNVTIKAKIKTVQERVDRKNNLMAFVDLEYDDVIFSSLIFSSIYCKIAGLFDKKFHKEVKVIGKKDDSGKFIVRDAMPVF